MTEETETTTLEQAQALEAQIAEAQRKRDAFEVTRLAELESYLSGTQIKNVLAKLEELGAGSLPGGHANNAAINLAAGIQKAASDISTRKSAITARLNPIPAIPDLSMTDPGGSSAPAQPSQAV